MAARVSGGHGGGRAGGSVPEEVEETGSPGITGARAGTVPLRSTSGVGICVEGVLARSDRAAVEEDRASMSSAEARGGLVAALAATLFSEEQLGCFATLGSRMKASAWNWRARWRRSLLSDLGRAAR